MGEYRGKIVVEFWMNLIPFLLISLILIVIFFFLPKLCRELEWLKWINTIRVSFLILIVAILMWGHYEISPLYLDLKENTLLEYCGEIEYQEGKGDQYSSYYMLRDVNVCVDSLVSIEANIHRCNARVLYTVHAKKAVLIDVHEILETRAPIDIR